MDKDLNGLYIETQIELLLKQIIEDFQENGETDIDIELVMNLMNTYAVSDTKYEENILRWNGYIKKILDLISQRKELLQNQLGQHVKYDKALKAYNKIDFISNKPEGE